MAARVAADAAAKTALPVGRSRHHYTAVGASAGMSGCRGGVHVGIAGEGELRPRLVARARDVRFRGDRSRMLRVDDDALAELKVPRAMRPRAVEIVQITDTFAAVTSITGTDSPVACSSPA